MLLLYSPVDIISANFRASRRPADGGIEQAERSH